jgi:transposase
MEHYVGLDVSLKLTAICIVDRTGKIVREGVVTSDPETIVAFIKSHAPHVARVGLETGATSTWLWTELNKMGLPVICIDARHAKAVLKMQINKSSGSPASNLFQLATGPVLGEGRLGDTAGGYVLRLRAGQGVCNEIDRSQSCIPMRSVAPSGTVNIGNMF